MRQLFFATIINILIGTIFYSSINKRCVDAFWSKVVGECGGARYDSVLRWFSSAPSHVRDTFRQTWNHRCDRSCHTYLQINFISTSITYIIVSYYIISFTIHSYLAHFYSSSFLLEKFRSTFLLRIYPFLTYLFLLRFVRQRNTV